MNSDLQSSDKHEMIFLLEDISFDSQFVDEQYPDPDSPRAFSTLEAAQQYRARLTEYKRASQFYQKSWETIRQVERHIIRQYRIDDQSYPQLCVNAWEYSIDGELLPEGPEIAGVPVESVFSPGDLVEIMPRITNRESPVFERQFGVIVGPVDTEPASHSVYRLYSIHENGHLIENRMNSNFLRIWENELPISLLFLRVYSEHLKGVHPLPHSVTKYIRPGDTDIIVANVPTFDFEGRRMRPEFGRVASS